MHAIRNTEESNLQAQFQDVVVRGARTLLSAQGCESLLRSFCIGGFIPIPSL